MKVIFNGLGPGNTFRYFGCDYKDGQIAEMDESHTFIAQQHRWAIEATDENVLKVRKLLESANKKRTEILQKVASLNEAQK